MNDLGISSDEHAHCYKLQEAICTYEVDCKKSKVPLSFLCFIGDPFLYINL